MPTGAEAGSADAAVDLRSDTVTRPPEGMRRAMARAEVGDDALGDDPTTRRLEETVAGILGKERALFFPSGIMANQTALAVLAAWGGEVVVEAGAHVLHYEEGASAALSGLQLRAVATADGVLTAEAVASAIRSDSPYVPRTRAVALENTHLASGGRIMPVEVAAEIGALARDRGLPVHLDGARLWHAEAETGRSVDAWSRHADTVMVALSKGLGCPVGSVLAGPSDVMAEAWRVRRRFGGAMRQSGILAAAGLYALEHHREALPEDHRRARRLADSLGAVEGLRAVAPETNIVLVEVDEGGPSRSGLLSFLRKHRILMLKFGASGLRAVVHRDIDDRGIARAARALAAWRRRSGPPGGVA